MSATSYTTTYYNFYDSQHKTKSWADYKHDEPLPVIPWAPHIKPPLINSPDSDLWTTVKRKKKYK